MCCLGPLFVTVTWGAGGSTAEKSMGLVKYIQDLGNTTCLHLTCTNMDRSLLDKALNSAKAYGIRNILALRGDPPRDEEYDSSRSSEFSYAVDLVRYIRKNYGDYFCIGVAGYPEGHVDGSDGSNQDLAKDLSYLVEKVEAGADFIITQLFYDVDKFLEYESILRNHESKKLAKTPIIPGLMPINSFQSFIRVSKLSHAFIPEDLSKSLEVIKGNDEQVKLRGVQVISSMIDRIYRETQGRVRGFHFYTLNLEKSVAMAVENSNVLQIPGSGTDSEDSGSTSALEISPEVKIDGDHQNTQKRRRRSSANAHNRLIVSESKGDINPLNTVPASKLGTVLASRSKEFLAISTGEGSLGREANWDDFPNGRFGDSRSPAYGEIDGYGPSLKVDNAKARRLWGYPVDENDISKLFISHITGQLEALPWSDEALDRETALIQEQLINLNESGLWTIASQPACNAAKSDDKIFGWGPPLGRVFQKAFVEFFISSDKWNALKKKLDQEDVSRAVSYYACDQTYHLTTNTKNDSSNAVTWGVFPNREILQSTIIEGVSFLSWAEEAFSLWKEWQHIYPKASATHKLLAQVIQNYYLVTVVHHDYMNEEALWELLLS